MTDTRGPGNPSIAEGQDPAVCCTREDPAVASTRTDFHPSANGYRFSPLSTTNLPPIRVWGVAIRRGVDAFPAVGRRAGSCLGVGDPPTTTCLECVNHRPRCQACAVLPITDPDDVERAAGDRLADAGQGESSLLEIDHSNQPSASGD